MPLTAPARSALDWPGSPYPGGAVRQVRPLETIVRAPRVFVFRSLTAFGEASPCWERGLEPQLVDQDGATLTVRFHTRVLGRTFSHLDAVRLRPPEQIAYDRLPGSRIDLRAEVLLLPVDARSTRLRVTAVVGVSLPFASGLGERAVAALLRRSVGDLLGHYRVTIEAAARAAGLVEPDDAPRARRLSLHRHP